MKKIIAATVMVLSLAAATAHARIYIPIDQPSDRAFPIAIPDLKGRHGKEIAKIIRSDMELSGYFRVLPQSIFRGVARKEGISAETIRFSFWSAIEAQALVKGDVEVEEGKLVITLRLFDPYLKAMLVGKQYTTDKKQLRQVAHRFSDEIMEALTGIRGVFNTKIAYTAITGKGRKEIYAMDMDGHRPFAVTRYKSISISPSWSPDGRQIVFTSYMQGQPDLYVTNLGGSSPMKITGGTGTNITPAWSPTGNLIAFASSATGVSNLYTIPSTGRTMRRITDSASIDISPAWSPGGNAIVFASERAGGLHLYRTTPAGGEVRRLTFVGYQNDMPAYSPMGDKIAFAGRDLGTFDIFIMNPDGSNIQRLTVASGRNEHPSFSPDGRFIAFSSTRDGAVAIYIMRADGTNQTRTSKGNGMLPDWGPRVK
jgi:TolB protein